MVHDLQPYMCTYADCTDPSRMYNRRSQWAEHEAGHRKVWRCYEHFGALFTSRELLASHLRQEHSRSVGELEISDLLDIAEASLADERKTCPICHADGPFKRGIQNHIANHLERIALFALPRGLDVIEDASAASNHGVGASSRGSSSCMSLHYSDEDYAADKGTQCEDGEHRTETEISEEQEKQAFEEWLSPIDFSSRQRQLFDARSPQSGRWLLESAEFTAWVSGRPWQLWCHGSPGAGKTMLASVVINHLQQDTEYVPVLYMFLSYQNEEHTVRNLFGALLRQFTRLGLRPSVVSSLLKMKNARSKYQSLLSLEYVLTVLKEYIASFERVYLIIDGLDECSEKNRVELMSRLRGITQQNLSVMVFSRKLPELVSHVSIDCDHCGRTNLNLYRQCEICKKGKFHLCEECIDLGLRCLDKSHALSEPDRVSVEISSEDAGRDIEMYIRREISKEKAAGTPDSRSRLGGMLTEIPEFENAAVKAVMEKSNGMFHMARLLIDWLRTHTATIADTTLPPVPVPTELDDLYEVLASLPADLDVVFQETMHTALNVTTEAGQISAKDVVCMVWIVYRPLRLVEFQHVLTDLLARRRKSNHDVATITVEPVDIHWISQGLVVIGDDHVWLSHASMGNYLEHLGPQWLKDAHLQMAQECLRHMSDMISRLQANSNALEEAINRCPFVGYASSSWGAHVREALHDTRAGDASTINDHRHLVAAVTKFVRNADHMKNYHRLRYTQTPRELRRDSWRYIRGPIHALHICAWFGLHSIMALLDPSGEDTEVEEPVFLETPLVYACREKQTNTIAYLVRDRGASVSRFSRSNRTPFYEALATGDSEIVRIMMKAASFDINAVQDKNTQRTAIMIAAVEGNPTMIETLLGCPGSDPNRQDEQGYTALMLAIIRLRDDMTVWDRRRWITCVAELLKTPGVNVNVQRQGSDGLTALEIATRTFQPKIVDMLLQHGADPFSTDIWSKPLVFMALTKGEIAILVTRISQGLDPSQCINSRGWTMMHAAAYLPENTAENIIPILWGHKLDIDAMDHEVQTPLHHASEQGNLAAIKALLDLGADIECVNNAGRTPLAVACYPSHQNVAIGLLLEKKANIVTHDYDGNSPLHFVCKAGNLANGRTLLVFGANVECRDHTRKTPLMVAASSGLQENLVKLLCENGANITAQDHNGDTALHLACRFGTKTAVEDLLDLGADVDSRNDADQTPLMEAIVAERDEIVELFESRGALTREQRSPHLV